MRLLLVEDEPDMALVLKSALLRHGINVDHAPTLSIASEALRSSLHDVVLIDRRLPDGDGLTLVTELRQARRRIPSIVISSMKSTPDRIDGLNLGADDYLPKPFEIDELLARIRAVMRRAPEPVAEISSIGRLQFHAETRDAWVDDQRLALTRRELLILQCFMRRPGATVVRSVLEDAVYGYDDDIQSNSIEAHVSRLRKKLSEANSGVLIHTVRGVGYLLQSEPEA